MREHAGDKLSEIFKTWLKVTEIESLNPPLKLSDFEPAPGLSKESSLLNQSAFGYAYLKAAPQDEHFWLFQANPKYYDFSGAVRELDTIPWAVNQYRKEIRKNDFVFLWEAGKDAGIVATGTILADPSEMARDEREEEFIIDKEKFVEASLSVPIKIDRVLERRIRREDLLNDPALKELEVIRFANATNFRVDPEKAKLLLRLMEEPRALNPPYSLDAWAEDSGLERTTLESWIRAIERKGQAILYGPPGTGKTYMARLIARHLIGGGDGFTDLVQFHPAYTYEDFIEGIRPKARNDGQLTYPTVPGRFLIFCRETAHRKGPCVMIIDEINRANLSRVLGELIYLLEYRDEDIKLAGGESFKIPSNVRIIGTMNTADRSIALVDHALRRRFAFLELYPKYEILEHYHTKTGFPVGGLIETLQQINRQINDRHYQIGVTFFLRKDLSKQIEDIWKMEIEPYLEEYFFDPDQQEKLNQMRWGKVKGKILT